MSLLEKLADFIFRTNQAKDAFDRLKDKEE